MQHICLGCGHLYDELAGDSANGIPPGTAFADLPHDWSCPFCGASKDHFEPADAD